MSSHGNNDNHEELSRDFGDKEVKRSRSDPAFINDIAARWLSMSAQTNAATIDPFATQEQLVGDNYNNLSKDPLLQSLRADAPILTSTTSHATNSKDFETNRTENDKTLRSGNKAASQTQSILTDMFAPPLATQISSQHGSKKQPIKDDPLTVFLSQQTKVPAFVDSTGAPPSPISPTPLTVNPNSIHLPPLRAAPRNETETMPTLRHQRLISWGNGIQQPSLANPAEGTSPPLYPNRIASTARGRSIALGDILQSSPYETEAEAYILKALEKHNRPRTSTLDSGMWSTADQATHEFDDTQQQQQYHDESSFTPATPTGQQYQQASADDTLEHMTENHPGPAVPISRQSSMTSNSQQQRERHPLLAKKPTRLQKRQVSVQDHLQGLTSAMQALDAHDELSPELDTASTKTEPIRKNEIPTTARAHRRHGSADQFASNAVKIMDRTDVENQAETASAVVGNGGKGHRRWGTLDNNLSVLEEDGASDLSQDSVRINDSTQKPNENDSHEQHTDGTATSKHHLRRRNSLWARWKDMVREDFAIWNKFFRLRRVHTWKFLKNALCYIVLPATAVSAILFYAAENPPTGRGVVGSAAASASWWILFICVRQMITFVLALGAQAIVIDLLGLETKILLRLFGPFLSLLIVQSKGWPSILMFWAIFDFILLQGDWSFAQHWGCFQQYVGLFNVDNPSGHIVDSHWNQVILGTAVGISGVTSIKRFLIGLYQGRQLFTQYGHQLAKIMDKMLLISQVAGLAKDIERVANSPDPGFSWNDEPLRGLTFTDSDDDSASRSLMDVDQKNPLAGALGRSGTQHLYQLLEEWEEPDIDRQSDYDEDVTISAVLKFRKALFFIQKEFPFSYSFGAASSREECVASAQKVYERLVLHKIERDYLHFETLALLALDSKGRVDADKARQLIKLFRPDRDGKLDLVDFVKSIDAIYKRYRLLLASIANTNAIDRASERIFNFAYYILVIVIVTMAWGFDPISIFLSLSSIVLAFAFMIGKASASYFDGVMFILVRRPYGIGDRIHVSNIESETDINGSLGWVVENITLYETTAVWTPTRERCSLSNGSLASSRIINGARSPQAQFLIPFKFPINTPYEKILLFKIAVEEYLKARPREWLMMTGFRASKIAPDLGFIEYDMFVMHRESWQQHNQLQDSKANFQSYCLEVSTQLGMHYTAPPLPVDLRLPDQANAERDYTPDVDSVARMDDFRSLAMTHHKIGWVGN